MTDPSHERGLNETGKKLLILGMSVALVATDVDGFFPVNLFLFIISHNFSNFVNFSLS